MDGSVLVLLYSLAELVSGDYLILVLTMRSASPATHSIPAESMFCPVTSPSSPISSSTGGVAGSRPPIASTKPVPPPAPVRKDPPALQRVVFPEKEACSK